MTMSIAASVLRAGGLTLIALLCSCGDSRGVVVPESGDDASVATTDVLVNVGPADTATVSTPWDAPIAPVSDGPAASTFQPDTGAAIDTFAPGPGSCPAGLLWVESFPDYSNFTAFCGQVCGTTSDCLAGSHCVALVAATSNPGPICVSTTIPPPVTKPQQGWHWDMGFFDCIDSNTLAARYNEPINQVAGRERIACPNGCVSWSDAGTGAAHCR